VSTPAGPCGRCGRPMVSQRAEVVPEGAVRHNARGLCTGCRSHAVRHGLLADYERATRSIEETLTDYKVLRDRGLDHEQVAEHLGMKPASLQRALERARSRDRTTCHHRTHEASLTCEEYVL
jgi:hypothetical protein